MVQILLGGPCRRHSVINAYKDRANRFSSEVDRAAENVGQLPKSNESCIAKTYSRQENSRSPSTEVSEEPREEDFTLESICAQ